MELGEQERAGTCEPNTSCPPGPRATVWTVWAPDMGVPCTMAPDTMAPDTMAPEVGHCTMVGATATVPGSCLTGARGLWATVGVITVVMTVGLGGPCRCHGKAQKQEWWRLPV